MLKSGTQACTTGEVVPAHHCDTLSCASLLTSFIACWLRIRCGIIDFFRRSLGKGVTKVR